MLRLTLFILANALAVNSYAEALDTNLLNQQASALDTLQGIEPTEELAEFTELEYQLVESSGLLSLSQQVKYSAQRLIALSVDKPEAALETSAEEPAADIIAINHAQHFAIAKNLAKRWTEEEWQQRLLELVHAIPVETQLLIQQQLVHPMVQASQRKEREAISAQHSPEYLLYMNKLRQQPPAASRWQLVESLDTQSGFSQMIIQARSAVIKEMQQQVEGWQPEEFWQNQARQEVLEFLFYAYRKTPNNELKHIAQSFNQPELSQFYADVRLAIQ